jgi:hypothetical protein
MARLRWAPVVLTLVLVPVACATAQPLAEPSASPQAPGANPQTPAAPAQARVEAQPRLTPEQMHAFLTTAKIIRERDSGKGVTDTVRATLSDGTLTHDAQFQTVDEARAIFEAGAKSEINFKDTYRYNIAGYRLAQLVGLQTVPMSAERRYKGKDSAVTWWIDDVMFDEGGRQALKGKMMGPDPARTQKQLYVMYAWDELIQNRDRNQGNLQWTRDWTLWLIDHTRAFRTGDELLKPERLVRCERSFFEGLKQLTEQSLTQAMKGILRQEEIRPILRRRDVIVQHFEKLIAERGEDAVLYSL